MCFKLLLQTRLPTVSEEKTEAEAGRWEQGSRRGRSAGGVTSQCPGWGTEDFPRQRLYSGQFVHRLVVLEINAY